MAEDEQLLGDKTAALLAAVKADRIAKAIWRVTKRPCNCGHRKMKLNELHRKLREGKAAREAAVAEKQKG